MILEDLAKGDVLTSVQNKAIATAVIQKIKNPGKFFNRKGSITFIGGIGPFTGKKVTVNFTWMKEFLLTPSNSVYRNDTKIHP